MLRNLKIYKKLIKYYLIIKIEIFINNMDTKVSFLIKEEFYCKFSYKVQIEIKDSIHKEN